MVQPLKRVLQLLVQSHSLDRIAVTISSRRSSLMRKPGSTGYSFPLAWISEKGRSRRSIPFYQVPPGSLRFSGGPVPKSTMCNSIVGDLEVMCPVLSENPGANQAHKPAHKQSHSYFRFRKRIGKIQTHDAKANSHPTKQGPPMELFMVSHDVCSYYILFPLLVSPVPKGGPYSSNCEKFKNHL